MEPVIEEVHREEGKTPCPTRVPGKADQLEVLVDPNVGTDFKAFEEYLSGRKCYPTLLIKVLLEMCAYGHKEIHIYINLKCSNAVHWQLLYITLKENSN